MAMNPEGSPNPASEVVPGPRFTAVEGVRLVGEEDLAEEYEAALEGNTPSPSVSIGHVSIEEVDEFPPIGADGEPQDDLDDTLQRPQRRGKGEGGKRDQLFGQVLADRYRVLDLIGKGGMGKVYLAEHVALGKKLAVKVLNPAYTGRPEQVQRFLREARAASKIDHENVIDITDFGEMANGQVFFAMEHLQGEDLGKLLKKTGALPWPRARRVMLQICRALQAAHTRGIVHRDMKPENVFLIPRNGIRDFVKVLDFGIAKTFEGDREGMSNPLTQVGALIGTPEYMAPEQIHGDPADLRMDIYAVGCIMYQVLTGNLPFTDKTMYGVLSQQVNAKPVPPRQLAPEADIPVEVEAIILRAMEKDRTRRYQTMAEMIEAIVAAPRGAGVAGATVPNLEGAAEAARAAMGAPATGRPAGAGGDAMTPSDDALMQGAGAVLQSGMLNTSPGLTPTAESGPWRRAAMDPRLLTRLVIGLGAAVLVLIVGLVYLLSREDEPKPATGEVVVAADAQRPEAGPAQEKVEPPPSVTKVPPDEETIIVDDPPAKEPAVVKEPAPKKGEAKKPREPTPKKVEAGAPASWPETLGPMERSAALKSYRADFEACRAPSTPKGKTYRLRLKVDGPKGRVLEATPDDAGAEAKCLARVFKTKVRFGSSRKSPQEFPIVVAL